MVIALQLVGRAGHANVVPVAPRRVEPGPIDHDEDDTGVRFAFTLRTCLGGLGTLLVAALANLAGIGGGAFYVPLFYAVSGFSLKAATGLSQAAIAGGSLVTTLFNLGMRHPWDPGRPLVDLDLALVLTPAMLLGVSVGVLLNDLVPTWAVLLLLICLLAVDCKAAALRGLTMRAEERSKLAAAKAAAAIRSGPVPRLPPIHITHVTSAPGLPARLQVVISREASRARIADSSDDEEAAGGGGGSSRRGSASGTLAAAGAAAAAVEAVGPASPALARLPADDGGGTPAGRTPLATVPSGDSDGISGEGQPASPRRHGGGAGAGGAGGGAGDAAGCLQSVSGDGERESEGGGFGSRRRRGEDVFEQAMESEGTTGQWDVERQGSQAQQQQQQHQQHQQQEQEQQGARQRSEAWAAQANSNGNGAGHGTGYSGDPEEASASGTGRKRRAGAASTARSGQQQQQHGSPATPSWLSGAGPPPRRRARFQWIKLVSLALLWLGFLGLSALDALLPLCSLQYIVYVLLFLATTLGVTAMFIRAIFLGPANSIAVSHRAGGRKPWLQASPPASLSLGGVASGAGGGGSVGGGSAVLQPLLEAGGGGSGFSGSPDRETLGSEPPESLSTVAAFSAAVAGAAGLLAGAAGLGGGSMLGSALLDFRVATATSAVLLFVSSTAATLSYVMEGRLIFSYAAAFAGCAALGSLLGACFVAAAARRSMRASTAVLLLAAAAAAGAALTAGLGAGGIFKSAAIEVLRIERRLMTTGEITK
ncbi:hypothetical protein MNEG_3365 [Monoraphidium neglectum]|uniref:Sulfite exporter TauE/SafE n=1 Tax=Monoraphidium neglectum TaxID=145388 RepID=A0A0D2LCY8_9CHLO|nr:hypothetical protein MNEG_3365 [Monoraphidium neglectum]KIZ04589.1 hypothetical protein MNEG_3365 [Monoraphidium neglectum]|eukprot:XP_013903608.1 hypothetical protein MNEG_3365 [Monoraphidium neglectum]